MDEYLDFLKEEYIRNFSPKIKAGEICSENSQLCEREDDSRRRKIADDYFNLLVNNVTDAKKEIKKVEENYQYVIDYSNVFGRDGIRLVFMPFTGDDQYILAFWDEPTKTMEININNFPQFVQCIKRKSFKQILLHFEETICHELIHMFDYQRYRKEFQPRNFKSIINNSPEFEAYFQQYARKMDKLLKTVTSKASFYNIIGNHAGDFINGFWTTIPKEMADTIRDSKSYTNKWNKRLFQLYHELMAKI